jgi:hypothetical protein
MTKKQHDLRVIMLPIDYNLQEFSDEGNGLRCVGCGKMTLYREVAGKGIYVRMAKHLSDCLFVKNDNPYAEQ